MNNEYKKILSYYEDFKLHKGALFGNEGMFDYQAPSSLHSKVTTFAYGIRETKSCISIKDSACISKVFLNENDCKRRFYLKLKACLFDWHKYVCGITITVNGKLAYENCKEFFENVNLGWPSIYIPIDNCLLNPGENIFKLCQTSGETALLVSDIDLLSLPLAFEGQQLTLKTAVRMNDEFALSFFASKDIVTVECEESCFVSEILPSPLNCYQTIVKIKVFGENPKLTLNINGKLIYVVMPEVFPASNDYCMIGTDSDDHRHDDSDETERIIEIFANSNMGNFWQARPKKLRNYFDLSDEKTWEKRVDYLKAFNCRTSLSDSANVMPYFAKLCGENFVGKHFHEPYLYFCSALVYNENAVKELFIDPDALKNSESFGETKKLFLDVLQKMYFSCKVDAGLTSVGSPSLLTCYEAKSRFERVTIEPVSNINLLIGAVRGVASKMWGAHVPTDWYFGEPNDLIKAKKFLLAMQLLYIHGADYIYAENALFKTNAFSREDWEDEFCVTCRKYLREFYEYTIKNPREGKLKTDLAVIYGNNEYFMWHHDDRIGELAENDNWDISLWGKWKDNSHHKCWRAIDAWLPLAEKQNTKDNILNQKLFSGTTYGSVNIIPYESDYKDYKAIALLGWNTYEEGFAEKIHDYVEQGGVIFVSYCHFNKTDRNDLPMEYADTSTLYIKSGEIISPSETETNVALVRCDIDGGEKIVVDKDGNVIVWRKNIGKGTLYFGAFADYSCSERKMEIMKNVLKCMGESTADIICTNPNICFTVRVREDKKRVVDLLNVSAGKQKAEKFELLFKDGAKYEGEATPCQIQTIRL